MTTATATGARRPAPSDRRRGRVPSPVRARPVADGSSHGARSASSLMLVSRSSGSLPAVGLLVVVAALRTADNAATGWWTVFTEPGQLTLDNYRASSTTPASRSRSGTPC